MNPTVGTRLLLVDDDRLVLTTLARELTGLGYVVEPAASAEEALRRCETGSFDLALVDIRLPGVSGLDFAKVLTDRCNLPYLFLSALSDPETVREARGRGAQGYLVKPLTGAQIVPAIETGLARAREERTLRDREKHLSVALSANRETSIAVGIVMAREGLDRIKAFELLRQRARSQRRKLAEVAGEIVLAAERLSFGKPPLREELQEPPESPDGPNGT